VEFYCLVSLFSVPRLVSVNDNKTSSSPTSFAKSHPSPLSSQLNFPTLFLFFHSIHSVCLRL